jgi:hypothetical protein
MWCELTSDKIMQLGLGFWGSKTFLSGIEIGVFTELAKGPQDGESLRTASIFTRAAHGISSIFTRAAHGISLKLSCRLGMLRGNGS